MIQIGDKKFNTSRPKDIDARTLSASGCSPAEVQRHMQGMPLAHHVARALHPFLSGDDAPDVATLTDMIAAAGPIEVGGQVATLYAAVPSVADEAPTGGE